MKIEIFELDRTQSLWENTVEYILTETGAWLYADEIYRGAELSGEDTPSFYGRYKKAIVAGGIEEGSLTSDICQRCVDDFVLVSENQIRDALICMIEKHHMLIEGAAALSVASSIPLKDRLAKKNVVLIISGNKISPDKLETVICADSRQDIFDQREFH